MHTFPKVLGVRPQVRCLREPYGNESRTDTGCNEETKASTKEDLEAHLAQETLRDDVILHVAGQFGSRRRV